MERARLKNIIILILLMLNLFLLFSMAAHRFRTDSAQDRIAMELSELFASDGISLDASAVPTGTAPAALTPIRSIEEDRQLAVFFLGEDLNALDEGGGIYTCRSSRGEALFRSNGSFDIRLLVSDMLPEELILQFCQAFGYQDITWTVQDDGSSAASAVQYVGGCPVTDAAAVFHIESGHLATISGTHLPQGSTVSEEASLTAATAMTLFLQERRISGAVVSSVSRVYPCYRLQTTSASPMALSPAWCILTDTGAYYVNAISGMVTMP